MDYIKLNTNEVSVGQSLPWAVFDEQGKLLLRKGYVLHSQHQLEVLMARGLFRSSKESAESASGMELEDFPEEEMSPFQMVAHICHRLELVFDNYQKHPANFISCIGKIVNNVLELCETDPDAGLGAVHLYDEQRYTVVHPVHQALICAIVAIEMKQDAEKVKSIIAAALTANIAMNELQEVLHVQTAPLTEEQRDQIYDHPDESVRILKRLGVKDELWLTIVEQHHERMDGSGYPANLSDDEICHEARLLAIADRYSAMVSTREYREAIQAKDALRNFFVSKGKEFDETLSLLFIKCLGVLSPGTFVKLANGESGVVIRRSSENSMNPIVSSFMSPRAGLFAHPFIRNTSEEAYTIKETCERPADCQLNLHILWGYQ